MWGGLKTLPNIVACVIPEIGFYAQSPKVTWSIHISKREKKGDFKNLLDESRRGGLSQLLGIGGTHAPSLYGSFPIFLPKDLNLFGFPLAYIYKLPLMGKER